MQTNKNVLFLLASVWREWVILNNTFEAMLLANGDMCPGNIPRQTKVQSKTIMIHLFITITISKLFNTKSTFELVYNVIFMNMSGILPPIHKNLIAVEPPCSTTSLKWLKRHIFPSKSPTVSMSHNRPHVVQNDHRHFLWWQFYNYFSIVFFLPPLSNHLMPGVMFLFSVCTFTGPLIVYKELSVAAWNYTCHNLEIVCN